MDDFNKRSLTIRLDESEAIRFWTVFKAAKKRNKFINKTNAIRELLGLDDASALTEQEIEYFRTGKK